MRDLIRVTTVLALLGLVPALAIGQSPKVRPAETPVKARTWFNGQGSVGFDAVVEKVDKDSVTVLWVNERTGKESRWEFFALDIHKDGKYQESASSPNRYLWSDLKKGDKVSFNTLEDEGEKKRYVTDICIRRRPGGTLPVTQTPKDDRTRYRKEALLNDIDNGVDVSEKEIMEAFPPRFDPLTGGLETPTTFPAEYRTKISDIRDKKNAEKEKKEQELKATPPKKDDKK